MLTLIEWAKTKGSPVQQNMVEKLFPEERIYEYWPFRFTDELVIPYDREKSYPGVAFRKFNEALPEGTGVVQRDFEKLHPFGLDSDTEREFAKRDPMARLNRDRMNFNAAVIKFIQSVFYSNAASAGAAFADVDGFDGIVKRLSDAPSTPQIVSQGAVSGSDASTIFAVRFGENQCAPLMQSSGIELRDQGELQTGKVVMRTRIDSMGGVQIMNSRSVAMLRNITVGVPATVKKLDEMLERIEVENSQSVLFMTRRTKNQLKWDGLATLKSVVFNQGVSQLGNAVEMYGTTPIITSDALLNTETVV